MRSKRVAGLLICQRQGTNEDLDSGIAANAPVVRAIREIIDSGKIGKVRSLTLNTYRNTHAKGVTEWKTHWRREKKYSGGGIAMEDRHVAATFSPLASR